MLGTSEKQHQAVGGAEPGMLGGEGRQLPKIHLTASHEALKGGGAGLGLVFYTWIQFRKRQLQVPLYNKFKLNICVNEGLLSLRYFMDFLKRDTCRSFLKCPLEYSMSIPRSRGVTCHFPPTAIERGHF